MRHQSSTRHFNRDTKARQALMVSLVSNLLVSGKIVTTRPMAKEAQRQIEKLVTRAKKADLGARRELHKFFGKRAPVNVLVDQVAPVFAMRSGGFTKVSAYGQRRGDNAELFVLEFSEPVELDKKEIAGARKMTRGTDKKPSSSTLSTAKTKATKNKTADAAKAKKMNQRKSK